MNSDELFPSPDEEGWDHMRYIDMGKCATVSLPVAARIIGVSRGTAWDLNRRGIFPIPVIPVGTKLVISKVHLKRFLDSGGQDEFPLAS